MGGRVATRRRCFCCGFTCVFELKTIRSRDLHDPGPRRHDDVKRSYGLHSSQMAGRGRRKDARLEAQNLLQWLCSHTLTTKGNSYLRATEHGGHRPHAVVVANARFPTDDFFWQWVQLNVAHRTLKQLVPDASWGVARQHHGFACVYLLRPEHWNTEMWLQKFLEQRGNKEEWIRTRLLELRARAHFVQMQPGGAIPRAPAPQASTTSTSTTMFLEQKHFIQSRLHDL